MTDADLYAAARMYYEGERSQQDIADALGISRSKVSRLLTEARRRGIVRIEVLAPPEPDELADELTRLLGLRKVFLALATNSGEPPWSGLADCAADALAGLGLRQGQVLLVAWGRTTWSVAQHPLCPLPGVIVAPMMGGANEPMPWFQTNEVAQVVARQVGGEVSLLHAPAQPSPALRRELERDPSTLRTLRLWEGADAALLNIGAPPAIVGDYGPTYHPRDKDALAAAAGDVASRYYDLDGRPVRYGQEQRLLGITRDQLLRTPNKIGIASGEYKANSIIGAARAKLIDMLVTDARTAEMIVAKLDGASLSSRPARRPDAQAASS